MSQILFTGNLEGAIRWTEGEVEAFDKVLVGQGDYFACVGACGAMTLLEKAGCEHAKVVIQLDFVVSAKDVKEPSAEAISLGGKFYSKISLNGGREIADEAIKQDEEEAYRVKEQARKAEEAVELERHIAELSPPPEPYNPEADPSLKGILDEFRVVNAAIDEAIDKLLNEAAQEVLKEDD